MALMQASKQEESINSDSLKRAPSFEQSFAQDMRIEGQRRASYFDQKFDWKNFQEDMCSHVFELEEAAQVVQ